MINSAALERCGVNPDANGVLASRGRFCRRRSNWSDGIERWCTEPAEDRGVVMTGRATLRAVGREVNGIRRKLAFLASTPSFR